MWTPQSVGSPPERDIGSGTRPAGHVRKTTADLKDQMQAMIDLQVMQQQQYEAPPPVLLKSELETNATAAAGTNNDTNKTDSLQYPTQDGVGRGTLLFASQVMSLQQQLQQQSRNTSPTMGSALSSPPVPAPPLPVPPQHAEPPPVTSATGLLAKQPLPGQTSALHGQVVGNMRSAGGYGATQPVSSQTPVGRRLSSLSDEAGAADQQSSNEAAPLRQANIYHLEGLPPANADLELNDDQEAAHHHDFHYGQHYDDYYQREIPRSRVNRYCCCLIQPLVDLFRWFCRNPDLHRSACLGAIDGLVTGSSLIAGLQGLNVWTPSQSSTEVRVWLVALSFAVAAAEAVCMAVGHIRTTQQGALQAWQGRQEVTLEVQTNRSGAKGHLVDMLLQRGLLKIDAMSIADTLEGYPDVCVSLLAGESLDHAGQSHGGLSGDNMAALLHEHVQPDWHNYDELDDPEGNGSNSRAVRRAVAEAWTEAIGMMLGFGLAAVLPAVLIWGILPGPVKTHKEFSYVTSSYHTVPDGAGGAFVQPTTLLIFVMSMLMIVLGWAKAVLTAASSYFGTIVEGVLLLWLGYGVAYGMGSLARANLPAHYMLTIISSEPQSHL